MKKLLCLLVSVMCLAGLSACSDKKENGLISGNEITPMPATKAEQENEEEINKTETAGKEESREVINTDKADLEDSKLEESNLEADNEKKTKLWGRRKK